MNSLIQRLLVARATGTAPPSLIDEVLEQLFIGKPATARRAIQWALIRQAADLLPGTPWQRAEQLSAIIARWSGRSGDPIRALLCDAARTGLRLPSTPRGIYNIISTER